MSVINQMLRELDARGVATNDISVDPPTPMALKRHRVSGRAVMGLLLAGVAGVAAYGWMSGASNAPTQPVLPGQLDTAPVPAPIAHAVAPAQTQPMPSGPVVAGVKANPGVATPFQLARELSVSLPAVASDAQTPLLPPAEPAVIKKQAKLPPELEAQQRYNEAQALRRAGNSDLAAAKYRQALELDPGMRPARLQLAGVLQESGQGEAALQLLISGYEQQPSDALAIATGRILVDQGRRDEALSWLERGRAGMRPSDSAMMGALLSQAQRFDEAVKAYQQALAFEPSQGGWSLGLGLALESQGRHDEARSAYRNALEHGKFKPEVLEFLQQKSRFPG